MIGWFMVVTYFIIGIGFWFITEIKVKKKLRSGEMRQSTYDLWKYDRFFGKVFMWPGAMVISIFNAIFNGFDFLIEKSVDAAIDAEEALKKEKK